MRTRPVVLVLVAAMGLLQTATTRAQGTNPPYFSQMPTVERVTAEILGTDPMDTAARQAGTFWQLEQIIRDLVYAQRRTDRQYTPDEQRLHNSYSVAHHYVYQPVLDALSDECKRTYHHLHGRYAYDPDFLDELLAKELLDCINRR